MKKIVLMILVSLVLALFSIGCATSSAQVSAPNKEVKQIKTQRAKQKLLGDRIGCSKKLPGYTKRGCGDDWGRELEIIWGDKQ